VQDNKTGDIILKMVNYSDAGKPMKVNLGKFGKIASQAEKTMLSGLPVDENTFENLQKVVPVTSLIEVAKTFEYLAPPMSLTVIRIKTK
jgi:alpha-L-arabinofuranosidase